MSVAVSLDSSKEIRCPSTGRPLSRRVRERNEKFGSTLWWQPSHAQPKVAPHRSSATTAAIEDELAVAPRATTAIAATTEFVQDAEVCDVTIERQYDALTEVAVVVIPPLEHGAGSNSIGDYGVEPRSSILDPLDEVDPEILELFEEDAGRSQIIALRATPSLPRHHLRRLLSRPADEDFDPTTRDWLSNEPRFLRAS